jgi:hypothetical protein
VKRHEAVDHRAKEYVRGVVHTNNIENFWSFLKRGVIGSTTTSRRNTCRSTWTNFSSATTIARTRIFSAAAILDKPTGNGEQPIEQTKPLLRRFHGTAALNSLRLSRDAGQIADEIVQHLTKLPGATVELTIEVQAKIPAGAPDDVVRTISENCRTLKFKNFDFEEDWTKPSKPMETDPKGIAVTVDTGADTFSRYVYQVEIAFRFCLDCALGGDVVSVVPEHLEDIALECRSSWRFLQIKTRNAELGPGNCRTSPLPMAGCEVFSAHSISFGQCPGNLRWNCIWKEQFIRQMKSSH